VAVGLRPATRLRGSVTSSAGQGLSGVAVSVFLAGEPTAVADAVTDATGAFTLADLPAGRLRLDLRPQPGHAPRQVSMTLAARDPDEPLVIALDATLPLRGVLLDDHGAPLAGCPVQLAPQDLDDPDASATRRAAVTGADGAFAFTDLAAGAWALRASGGRGLVTVRPGPEPLTVRRP
jgi:hypothetical protein